MLCRYNLVLLSFIFFPLALASYRNSNCYSRSCWSGWSSSNTGTSYRRTYCSADNVYCREGRAISAVRCPDRSYQDIVGVVETPIKKSDKDHFAERLTKNKNSEITFSSQDAHYMTARMISTLDYMVKELPRGFSLVVMDGYRDIDTGNVSFPLQYEGKLYVAVHVIVLLVSQPTTV